VAEKIIANAAPIRIHNPLTVRVQFTAVGLPVQGFVVGFSCQESRMHRKQDNFGTLIFITQSCTKGGKYIATAPREGPPAPQAESGNRQGNARGLWAPHKKSPPLVLR